MNSVVLIKQSPDTGTNLRFKDNTLNEDSLKWVFSPYDEFALEEALKLKSGKPDSKVYALSLGPSRVKESLIAALALGADEAFHLKLEDSLIDPLAVATALKKQIETMGDLPLIFCGKLSSDLNNFAVPQMLSRLLDRPFVTNVNHLEFKDGIIHLTRESDSGTLENLKVTGPVVLSADKGLNEPRYPSLPGIMKAKKKPFHEIEIQKPTEAIRLVSLMEPEQRKAAQILSGSADEQAQELVKILREQEKLL